MSDQAPNDSRSQPEHDPASWLRIARTAAPARPAAALLAATDYVFNDALDDEYWNDQTGDFRAAVCGLLIDKPQPTDRTLLRYLVEQEMENHRHNWGLDENLKLATWLLARLGDVRERAAAVGGQARQLRRRLRPRWRHAGRVGCGGDAAIPGGAARRGGAGDHSVHCIAAR